MYWFSLFYVITINADIPFVSAVLSFSLFIHTDEV